MNDYSRHYAILGVTRETDWKGLRARYKRLIGRWHPDRFPTDALGRELAEEQSKQISIAYQALEHYYRDYGVLPPMEPAKTSGEARVTSPDAGAARGSGEAGGPSPPGPTAGQPARRVPERYRALIVVFALLTATYAAYRYSDGRIREPDTGAASPRVPELAAPEAPPETQRESGGISAGSTLFEVYAIQGIPTLTEGDVWHYGKSSIYFAHGKVVSWTQHPDNPLRIARDLPVELRNGHFDIGSTKDEVRSVQGTPVTETETVWDYGPSRVYFEHNRVVRWEASPLQPLHVPR
jgi:DnaJ-like protein